MRHRVSAPQMKSPLISREIRGLHGFWRREGDSPTQARAADSLASESLRIPRASRIVGLLLSGNENARWRGHLNPGGERVRLDRIS